MPAALTALVTGASRGIGAACAVRLSHAGFRVVLTARDPERLAKVAARCPGPTAIVVADLLESVAADEIFSLAETQFGQVDVLVLNAGAAESAPLGRISDEAWDTQLAVNLTAPFRCLQRGVPAMKRQRYGRVVAVASVAAKQGEPYIAAYTAAKHGLLGLVRSAAAELAGSGVTVNAVCPGYVDNEMTDRSVANIADKTGQTAQEARQFLADKQAIGRLVTVDEVVDTIMMCVTNAAITGQGVNVDGGAVQS